MNQAIIPYPGLRPFTEEEAIFFKGRDTHIKQIITQLQAKKIVIVTGASGAGKSSLIFAGVVPNARAGFFKATFNSWKIVSFRPERSPLHNLSVNLARQLNLDYEEVFNELKFGFSALVNVYKNSDFYFELSQIQDPDKLKELKSKGANLLIIADQFEEFFTNPENFAHGRPSIDAYTTVNLLLETATIALQQNLPIFIIFTMRSDYISDCVAFKGLPEYIGFSQFFVPRLKRNELQQAIEEPAMLAGGSVSKRLSEVLINQIRDSSDPLPILQHTLHQLWLTANYGQEQLDLIHLSKNAGLHVSYLNETDKQIFLAWFEKLPDNEKKYFENPSLSNVLNYHANKLYDNAYLYFLENVPWVKDKTKITRQDTQLIIKKTFLGLTRIDQGRAVRNRITLKEITNLINQPHITYEVVNGVINIFREPGSTFIHPFIDPDQPESYYIPADTVLDITHEALIRNWRLLQKWEHEEEENVNDFLEFKVQLKRWLENNKRKEYLLPLGTLTYFEQWYERCKPNKYWIAKYDNSNLPYEEKLKAAEKLEQNIKLYLQKSRNYIIAQEKKRKAIRTVFAILSLIIILILIGFSSWALHEKRNAEIQRQLAEKKKNEAIAANRKAEQERQRAEMEKKRAELAAQKALLEKRKADSAKNIALKMMKIAEEQRIIAQQQALRALREKQKADSLRKIAELQKIKAIKASKEAQRLTLLSLAQSLSFKATQKYDDPQVNLLLAYYAYLLNKRNGGYKYDAAIYRGLLSAYSLAKNISPLKLDDKTVMDFYMPDLLTVLFQNISGKIFTYDLFENQKKLIHFRRKYQLKTNVSKSLFLNDTLLIAVDVYGNWYLINLNSRTSTVFNYAPAPSDALIFENYLLTASNKTLTLWRISNMTIKKVKNFTFRQRVIKILVDKNVQIFYVVTRYGTIYKLDLDNEKLTKIYKGHNRKLNNMATTADLSPDGTTIAMGHANGLITLIDIENQKIIDKLSVVNSMVKLTKFDFSGEKLITVCPDNTINIFILKKFHEKPITISLGNEKINQLRILPDKIFVLYKKNSLISFYLDPDDYASRIKPLIKRNFTQKEWQQFFGNTIAKFDIVK